jgi:hypothetical protein
MTWFGIGTYLFDRFYLKRSVSWRKVGVMGALGYLYGRTQIYYVPNALFARKFDPEII